VLDFGFVLNIVLVERPHFLVLPRLLSIDGSAVIILWENSNFKLLKHSQHKGVLFRNPSGSIFNRSIEGPHVIAYPFRVFLRVLELLLKDITKSVSTNSTANFVASLEDDEVLVVLGE
jgi:hypothetical protein